MAVAILHAAERYRQGDVESRNQVIDSEGQCARMIASHEASILLGGAHVWDCSRRNGSHELFNHREPHF